MKGTVGHFSLLPGDCSPPSYSQVKFLLLLLSPAAKVLPSCFWPPAILSSCSEPGRPRGHLLCMWGSLLCWDWVLLACPGGVSWYHSLKCRA